MSQAGSNIERMGIERRRHRGWLPKFIVKTRGVLFIIGVLFTQNVSTAWADDSLDRKAEEYIYSIFAVDKLSPEVRGRYAAKGTQRRALDPTLQIAWVMENWEKLSGTEREKLRPYINPDAVMPGGDGRVLPRVALLYGEQIAYSTHFEIHYSTTDLYNSVDPDDSQMPNGIPDYVDGIGMLLENAYSEEITNRGFHAPQLEIGMNRYRIYIEDMLHCGYLIDYSQRPCNAPTTWTLGLTVPFSNYPSSIIFLFDHDYDEPTLGKPADLAGITTVHEFFHAVQFGMSNGPPTNGNLWYFEGAAVWMEDEVYGSINTYLSHLSASDGDCNGWFNCTFISVTHENEYGIRPYGGAIFYKYFTEYKQKPNAVNDIMNNAAISGNAIAALKQYVLTTLGTAVPDMFLDFGLSLIECSGYRDCSLYDPTIGYSFYNVSSSVTISNNDYPVPIQHYAYDTIELYTTLGATTITPTATTGTNVRIGILKCTARRSGCTRVALGSAITGFGSTYPYVYAVIANGDDTNDVAQFSLTLTVGSGGGGGCNPDYCGTSPLCTFTLSPEVPLNIVDTMQPLVACTDREGQCYKTSAITTSDIKVQIYDMKDLANPTDDTIVSCKSGILLNNGAFTTKINPSDVETVGGNKTIRVTLEVPWLIAETLRFPCDKSRSIDTQYCHVTVAKNIRVIDNITTTFYAPSLPTSTGGGKEVGNIFCEKIFGGESYDVIGANDFSMLKNHYGTSKTACLCPATCPNGKCYAPYVDIDDDGTIGANDFTLMKLFYGKTINPAPSSVPHDVQGNAMCGGE